MLVGVRNIDHANSYQGTMQLCDPQAVRHNEGIQAEAVAVAPVLARLVEEGSTKLAQRASGVSALTAACYIAAASQEADDVFRQNKVSTAVLPFCPTQCCSNTQLIMQGTLSLF